MAMWALDEQVVKVRKKKLIPYKYLGACDEITAASEKRGRLVTQNSLYLFVFLGWFISGIKRTLKTTYPFYSSML